MDHGQPRTQGSLAIAQDYRDEPVRQAPSQHSPLRMLPPLPIAPDRLDALGLPERFIQDLALKTLHRITVPTPVGIANAMRVTPGIVREALDDLKRQRLVETTSASGRFESEWQVRRWAVFCLRSL